MANKNRIIFTLLILQPVIDLITSLSIRYSLGSISVGALARTVLMAFLFFYILHYLYSRKKGLLWMFFASFLGILCMVLVNVFLKQNYALFAEANFVLKTSYYLVIVFLAIILIENKRIDKAMIYNSAKLIGLIIGGSYWLSILTGSNIDSYTYENIGYSGWFYSANELSVTIIILLGLTLINLRYEKSLAAWLAFILIVSMVPMVGTKTAFLGGVLILFVYGLYLVFKFRLHTFQDKNRVLFFGVVAVFICCIPFTPIASNSKQMDFATKQRIEKINTNKKRDEAHVVTSNILSSRNVYFQDTKDDFIQAEGLRKAFGLGYAGSYTKDPKTIEMDFFDLFFSYGFIGTILLLIPLAYLGMKLIAFPLTIEKFILLFALGLCFGIATLAGHVLFAPSVMTYLGILFIAIGLENKREGMESF